MGLASGELNCTLDDVWYRGASGHLVLLFDVLCLVSVVAGENRSFVSCRPHL